MKIAIDGPAASGKSTIGFMLAHWLNYLYFDTGVMYRAVTLAALQHGIDIADIAAVSELAEKVVIEVLPPAVQDMRQYTVILDGQDVTWLLRSDEVELNVSYPSKYPAVREEMVRQQRRIAERGNVVMVGRDIGTVVLPHADLKIYLDASVEERARRRYNELIVRGESAIYEHVLDSMRHRDLIDSTRKVSPLMPAEDAIIVDSTGRDVDAVLSEIKHLVIHRVEMSKLA
jgi:CMP/dCMP kinase